MKKSLLFKGFIAGLVVFVVLGGFGVVTKHVVKTSQPKVNTINSLTPTSVISSFQYSGKEGVNALMLLKEHAVVHESTPGFVDSINGGKAESSKHEYWAFYVNGKLASVGAAQYITHDKDQIEWKIETY